MDGRRDAHPMTNPTDDDRPNTLHWPPVLYMVAAIAAVLIDRAGMTWPMAPSPALTSLGWGLAAAGVAVAIAGVVQFKVIGTPVDPTGKAQALATGGIYSLTRNPMYLGAVVMFAGLALALKSVGLLMVTAPLAVALYWLAIRREEAYLQRRFGAAYEDYRQRVGRWI